MAMKSKEGLHRREKSTSAPSSPRIINPTHGRRMSVGSPIPVDGELPALLLQKPTPHYLKPTISSGHDACPCATKQPASEAPAIAAKHLLSRRSIDKQSSPQRTRTSGTGSPRASPLFPKPAAGSPRTGRDKAVEAHASPKATRITKKRTETNGSEEMVLSIDAGSGGKKEDEHRPRDIHPVGFEPKTTRGCRSSSRAGQHQARSLKRAPAIGKKGEALNDGDEHYEGSVESLAGEDRAVGEKGGAGKLRVRRAKSLSAADMGGEGGARRLKFRQGEAAVGGKNGRACAALKKQEGKGRKEVPPVSNEVIKEATSLPAGKKPSKVAALVGAFETVISLREPDPIAPHHHQQQQKQVAKEEVAAKGVEGDGGGVEAEAAAMVGEKGGGEVEKEVVVVVVVAKCAEEGGGGSAELEERNDTKEGGGEVADEVKEAGEGGDGGVMTAAGVEEGVIGSSSAKELTESTEKGGEGSGTRAEGQ